jgi:hypothetical protein
MRRKAKTKQKEKATYEEEDFELDSAEPEDTTTIYSSGRFQVERAKVEES